MPTQPTGDQLAAKGVDIRPDPIKPDPVEVITGFPVADPPSVLVPSIDEIQAAVAARVTAAVAELDRLRAERDELSRLIKAAIVERDEAESLLNRFKPRAPRKPKATT
jgi:hypothetical protein